MNTLKSGSYLIINPRTYFNIYEYEVLKHNVDREKLSKDLDWGISSNNDFINFAWFNVGNSLFKDQYGDMYETDRLLCCVPIEMIDEDISLHEPFYFKEDFRVNYCNDAVMINHLQLIKLFDSVGD
jgi:hypothetical protein